MDKEYSVFKAKPIESLKIYEIVTGIITSLIFIISYAYPVFVDISSFGPNQGNFIVHIILSQIKMLLVFVISILIHELGHLFFGLISSRKFQSISILALTLKKEDGRYKFIKNKSKNPGIGQVITTNYGKYDNNKFILYNLGGLIFWFITLIILFSTNNAPYLRSITLGLTLIELVPMRYASGVGGNDIYNVLSLIFSPNIRSSFKVYEEIDPLYDDVSYSYEDLKEIEDCLLNSGYLFNKHLLYIYYANYFVKERKISEATHYLNLAKSMEDYFSDEERFFYLEDDIEKIENKLDLVEKTND